MADNETIADIRKDAETKFRELVESYMQRRAAFQTTVGAMQAFNTVFDRIEAAIKREKAAIEADALEVGGMVEAARKSELSKNASKNASNFGQLGDCAKLREVLDESRRIASDLGGCRLNDYWKLNEIVRVCDAALSAPPRNCDMPLVVDGPAGNNADKAWLVFKQHNPDAYFDVSWLLRCIDWLLAPATEKEGGNNAD